MRVLFYTEAPVQGGVTRVMGILLRGLREETEKFCVVPSSLRRENRSGKDVLFASKTKVSYIAIPHSPLGWFNPFTALAFRSMCLSVNPTVIHFHLHAPFTCLRAIALARLFSNARLVATEHYLSQLRFLRNKRRGWFLSAVRELYIRMNFFLKRHALQRIDHTILLSTGDREFFLSLFGEAMQSKCSVVFNGIETAEVASGKRINLGCPPDAKVVLTVADLNNQKGHRYLIDAVPDVLEQHPDAVFVFAGDGHLRSELEAHVKSKGLQAKVMFLGRRRDVPDLLATADLVVLPSLFEGLPLTLLEAMAASKAIVATDVGGNNDVIVDGETGYLVKPADSVALASRLIELLHDDGLRAMMAWNGNNRVRTDFEAQRMTEAVQVIYLS